MKLIIDESTTIDETGEPQITTWERWDFTSEVTLGAAMLDEMVPGWHRKVELSELALESGQRCVLGQLAMNQFYSDLAVHMYGGGEAPVFDDPEDEAYSFDYADLCRWLSQTEDDMKWLDHEGRDSYPCKYGFNVWFGHPAFPSEDDDPLRLEHLKRLAWENLTNDWERAIRMRITAENKAMAEEKAEKARAARERKKAAKVVVQAAEEAAQGKELVSA